MADAFPISTPCTANVAYDGKVASLGNTSDTNLNGAISVMFVPDGQWVGQAVVVGRAQKISTADVTIPWVPVPYRRVTLNNISQDYAMVGDVLTLTGPTLIHIPANGLMVGLLFAVAAGTCVLRAAVLNGAATP